MKLQQTLILKLVVLLGGTLGTFAQSGGPYRLNWHTIDGGGGRCAGDAFAIHGTIGQPESGEELRSDLPTLTGAFDSSEARALVDTVYSLRGGFWPGVVPDEVGPRLRIELDHPFNWVILTWPYPSPGFVLQQAASFHGQGGGWATVPMTGLPIGTNWQVNLRATNASRIFRLVRP